MLSMSRLHKFYSLPGLHKKLFIEAAIYLSLASILIKLLPFRYLSKLLGAHMAMRIKPLDQIDIEMIQIIGLSVQKAAKSMPWRPLCLPQAIAAKLMLKNRVIASTLFMGVSKKNGGQLHAHAWLNVDKVTVTGECNKNNYKILASFS